MGNQNAIRKAFELLLDSAMHNHKWECSCVQNGRIRNDIPCSCGASEHNRDILNALSVFRQAEHIPPTKWDVGIESPTFRFDGYI